MVNIVPALELGSGFGHARRKAAVVKALQLGGHYVVLATTAPQKSSSARVTAKPRSWDDEHFPCKADLPVAD
jgi:hypothetical protein